MYKSSGPTARGLITVRPYVDRVVGHDSYRRIFRVWRLITVRIPAPSEMATNFRHDRGSIAPLKTADFLIRRNSPARPVIISMDSLAQKGTTITITKATHPETISL